MEEAVEFKTIRIDMKYRNRTTTGTESKEPRIVRSSSGFGFGTGLRYKEDSKKPKGEFELYKPKGNS